MLAIVDRHPEAATIANETLPLGMSTKVIKLLRVSLSVAVELFVGTATAFVGFTRLMTAVAFKLSDITVARRRIKDGLLHCPSGHAIPEFGVYECEACGYRYEGSTWQCANPECGATTAHVPCPICSLSVRNPYRWGRR